MNSILRCCRAPSVSTAFARNRVSYYQPSSRWPPKFIRRFWLRYPNAHLWGALGICSVAVMFPVIPWFYNYMTMPRDEFIRYRDQYNMVVRERQRSGTNLYIPFFTSNAASAAALPKEEKKED